MKGLLVRVGIDQTYGGWNAPVDPATGAFAFVPIPGSPQRRGLETPYTDFAQELARFPGVLLPSKWVSKPMHLDPDFAYLTYGDTGDRRGRSLRELERGDFIAFYAGLRPTVPCRDPLSYALIGFYRVRECLPLPDIPQSRWHENAHTRSAGHHANDLIVRAEPGRSGRLERCIEIGEWRNRAYRVRRELLEEWGGLSCKDGYLQRSVVPPRFLRPDRFLAWFEAQRVSLLAVNNPSKEDTIPTTLVYKRTHNGDPDPQGRFGAYDCMGSVRAWAYDAVIGVGGIGAEPRRHNIAKKVNWIGIGAHRTHAGNRGPVVTFDHFRWFGKDGPWLAQVAPVLAEHIYGRNGRSLIRFTPREASEVRSILMLANDAPPSPARAGEAVTPDESPSRGSTTRRDPLGRQATPSRCTARDPRR